MSSTEIDFDNIVRLASWQLQLDQRPERRAGGNLKRELDKLNANEVLLVLIAEKIIEGRGHVVNTDSLERAELAKWLAEHLGTEVTMRIEVVISPPSKGSAFHSARGLTLRRG